MNWKKRYAHENYEIKLDPDDPYSIAAHLIQGHAGNFTSGGMDDTMVNSILADAEHEGGRAGLHHLHNFLHSRGFMTQHIDHEHPEDEE